LHELPAETPEGSRTHQQISDHAAKLLAAVVVARLISASTVAQTGPPQHPYSCHFYDDEQKKCASGSCDAGIVERLKRECLRDAGGP
jgi:hypothetical protein